MSPRTAFEDRLLQELKREIELREAVSTEVDTGERGTSTSVGRLVTPRRIALAAATCAVAGLAVVVVPGTPAESMAYAVQHHGDDRVTLTLKEAIDIDAQYDLAEELRPDGIEVDVAVLPPGYTCKPWGRGVTLQLLLTGKDGDVTIAERASAWTAPAQVTLSKGNVLVFENTKGSAEPRAIHAYEVERYALDSSTTKTEDQSEPCVPVKPTP
ncbi:hypothetical protein [Streptomyces sp. NBC_00576]|uniref:hypothetical protein n=1 Tax=Streptomyces sp. NBC_00576 TaxID=2903665 RepID=UPI002E804FEE|nr:hypothetical protein [Streptomyces sp. NBC_00576]WUB73771.1 hypothetical protein OG734_28935 [Streptomyces sp. NBC_00576]